MSNWTKGVLLIAGTLTALLAVTVSLVDADDRILLWGAGIIVIVLLVIPLIGMPFAVRHWKVIGITLVVCFGVAWGGFSYLTRPYRVEELAGVRLGMSRVAVTLALGEPRLKGDVTNVLEGMTARERRESARRRRMRNLQAELAGREPEPEPGRHWQQHWGYSSRDIFTGIYFRGQEASDYSRGFSRVRVRMIYTNRTDLSLFGVGWNYHALGVGSSESDVLERLGAPDTESINGTGTRKVIFYNEWQTGFEFERNKVFAIIVSTMGANYRGEYALEIPRQ